MTVYILIINCINGNNCGFNVERTASLMTMFKIVYKNKTQLVHIIVSTIKFKVVLNPHSSLYLQFGRDVRGNDIIMIILSLLLWLLSNMLLLLLLSWELGRIRCAYKRVFSVHVTVSP